VRGQSRKAVIITLGTVIGLAVSLSVAKVAVAVSGGPYSPPGQDCQWTSGSWNSPQDQVTPGCHNTQLSVESGGTTDGNPDNGWNDSSKGGNGARNTTWAQWGNDQAPVDNNAQGTPTEYSIGYPGQSTSPHAGCLALNTDGTGGGPAQEQSQTYNNGKGSNAKTTPPEGAKSAYTQTKYGCGNNTKGDGFDLTYDYYPLVCPLLTDAGVSSVECETYRGDDTDSKAGTPQAQDALNLQTDTGGQQNLTDVLTKGLIVYFGMDDNSDNGEHDGEGPTTSKQTDGAIVGSSDGGAVTASLTPQGASTTPSLSHPEGGGQLLDRLLCRRELWRSDHSAGDRVLRLWRQHR
jgi:hypothetical protein